MSTFRPRFSQPTAVTKPVVSHVKGIKAIHKSRAEALLSKFISTSEIVSTGAVDSTDAVAFTSIGMSSSAGKNPVLGQLRRIQRDLRGLPPLLAELDMDASKGSSETESVRNKRIKFDSEEPETQVYAQTVKEKEGDEEE